MSQINMNNFIDLSVILTGFTKHIIAPKLDPKNIKQVYYNILGSFPVAMTDGTTQKMDFINPLLSKYVELKNNGQSNEVIGETLITTDNGSNSFPSTALLAQSLMYLWYLGIIPGIQQSDTGFEYNKFGSSTAGSQAYTGGLTWNAMQAHPMGYSNQSYGYWSKKPVDFKYYMGEK